MPTNLTQLKQDFTEGLSQISRFWGFPKGMGAIFAVLYLSPVPLPLDEIVCDLRKAMQGISELVNAESTRSVSRPVVRSFWN